MFTYILSADFQPVLAPLYEDFHTSRTLKEIDTEFYTLFVFFIGKSDSDDEKNLFCIEARDKIIPHHGANRGVWSFDTFGEAILALPALAKRFAKEARMQNVYPCDDVGCKLDHSSKNVLVIPGDRPPDRHCLAPRKV